MPDFGNPFSGMLPGKKLDKDELIRAVRFSIAAEYEATQLYTMIAESTNDESVKSALLDIADEELVHAGEFMGLLKTLAPKEEGLYEKGEEEIRKFLKTGGFMDVTQITANLDSAATELEQVNPVLAYVLDRVSDRMEKFAATDAELLSALGKITNDNITPAIFKGLVVEDSMKTSINNLIKAPNKLKGPLSNVDTASALICLLNNETDFNVGWPKTWSMQSKIKVKNKNPKIVALLKSKFGSFFQV